ncbi:hypothetical protein [Peribacillus frigoritolerans]|uniref:hypothetical protein n=1 Tax=Peribacillus frigoritolerans TaxID=450367 RepID=UPI003018F887
MIIQQYGPIVEKRLNSTLQLPQFNTIFSQILAYSQDFITFEFKFTGKGSDFRT